MRPFFIFLILFAIPFRIDAQFAYTAQTKEAYSNLLSLKLNKGTSLLQKAKKSNPNDGIAIYLENYADVLEIFINENPSAYAAYLKKEEQRLAQLKKLKASSPYYLFTQAEIKLQGAFVRLKYGDEFSAVWNLRQAYKLLEENKSKYPEFLPQKKSIGLLYVLIGSVPDKYNWIAGMIGLYGNVSVGIRLLNEASHDPVYKLESELIKTSVNHYILQSEVQNFSDFSNLTKQYPDNLLIGFINCSVLMKEGQNEQALTILSKLPQTEEYLSIPFFDYMSGIIYLNKGHYTQSLKHLNRFLAKNKGNNFIKDTYYRCFLNYYLGNNKEKADMYLNKILSEGVTIYDTDKYADAFAKKKEYPNKEIMKIRLLTDGGYLEEAKEIIEEINIHVLSEKDKIEFTYRKARVFHKSHDYIEAILWYKNTIRVSALLPTYFAPNSALQLGYIYREEGNNLLAEEYFKQALTYKNHEYKNSIDNKAKAALDEIKNKKKK